MISNLTGIGRPSEPQAPIAAPPVQQPPPPVQPAPFQQPVQPPRPNPPAEQTIPY